MACVRPIHPKIIQKAITMNILRRYVVLTFSLVLMLASIATSAIAAEKPIKVYILSGQSNMVGIGQANPSGMTRYNTYVSADKDAKKGATLSIYRGVAAYPGELPVLDGGRPEFLESPANSVGIDGRIPVFGGRREKAP